MGACKLSLKALKAILPWLCLIRYVLSKGRTCDHNTIVHKGLVMSSHKILAEFPAPSSKKFMGGAGYRLSVGTPNKLARMLQDSSKHSFRLAKKGTHSPLVTSR